MCDNTVSVDYIFEVQRWILSGSNLKCFNWNELVKLLDCDYDDSQRNQALLLKETLNHPLVLQFPLKWAYQQLFLKTLIHKIEEASCEVADSLYKRYVELMEEARKEDGQHCHFKHYRLPNGKFISLKEETSIVSHGTTGLCSWQGALALMEWLLKERDYLDGKTVLELGSGTGLAGLSLIMSGNPSHYHFTDCHPEVLKQLCSNIRSNLLEPQPSIHDSDYEDSDSCELKRSSRLCWGSKYRGIGVKIWNLPWENISENSIEVQPDIIVASDVVYDQSLFDPLADTLEYFLNRREVYALLVCTIRDDKTFKEFIQVLERRGFSVSEIPVVEPNYIPFTLDTPIKFLKIEFKTGYSD